MITPIRAIAVGLLAVATGTAFLVAGPLAPSPEQAVIPAAATSPSPAPDEHPSHFSGSMRFANGGLGYDLGVTETGDDGVVRNRGAGPFDVTWDSDEARFDGTGTLSSNYDDYALDTGEVVRVGWGTQQLLTDDGGWTSIGPGAGVHFDPTGRPGETDSAIPVWFLGDGAYDGLSALLVYTVTFDQVGAPIWLFDGWIVPGAEHFEASAG